MYSDSRTSPLHKLKNVQDTAGKAEALFSLVLTLARRFSDTQELQPHPKYAPMHSIKYLLWWLISGTKGGKTRGRLILALRQRPANANQLAEVMVVDYKTARHHLEVLQRNGLVTYTGEGYGATYFLSPQLDENFSIFEEIWSQIGEKQKRV